MTWHAHDTLSHHPTRARMRAVNTVFLLSSFAVSACGTDTPMETETLVPTTLILSTTTVTLTEGETQQLSATVADQNGATMSSATVGWASSDGTVASVSSSGLVTALEDGTTTITATAGSASSTASVDVLDGPGPYSIDATANLVSVKPGDDLEIRIFAIDVDTGEDVPFTATSAGTCAMIATVDDVITVTGMAAACEQDIVVSAEDQTKTITVRGYDPTYLDIGGGLQISYADDFVWRWNDVDTDGDHDVTFWHPVPSAGWYALGSHVQIGYAAPNGLAPMVVVRDMSPGQDKLAAPTGYQQIWTDSGSGGYYNGSVWQPDCPGDFVALGSVVQAGHGMPSVDDVRCVAPEYTTDGTFGPWAYDDSGTNAGTDLGVWRVGPALLGNSPDGRAALDTRAMIGCPGHSTAACTLSDFRLLLVPLDIVATTDDLREPRLSGPTPLVSTGARFGSTVRIPFTLIPTENPTCGTTDCATATQRVANNVANSPFYYLERFESYSQIAELDNRAATSSTPFTHAYTNFFEETEASQFEREVGLSVTVDGDATFLGAGASYSVTLSTALRWTNSTSATYGQSSTTTFGPFTVEAGHYASLIQVSTEFRGRSEQGVLSGAFIRAGQNSVKYLRWPLD